jgi:23S rRNA pseudouridine1911/1915/1917 synthase
MYMGIHIIYEDDFLLAVNKPSGLIIHSDGKNTDKTLVDWILEKYPKIKNVGEPWILSNGETIYRPGIVHRLDKDTSGVLVIAKTDEAFVFLKKQFQSREIKKTYHAIVYGSMKKDTGIIDKPIGRSRSDFRKWSAEYGARGVLRDAITEYKVLARGNLKHVSEVSKIESFTYLEVYPKTGRTHQIRVHLKAIGYPVLCDALYAKGKPCLSREDGGIGRLALHASTLELAIPSGTNLKLEASPPDDFCAILKIAFDFIKKIK